MHIDLFEQYRAGHLALMVGGNPLPNAVAAHLLTRPDGRVTLFHSAETARVAGRTEDWLSSRTPEVSVEQCQIDACSKASVHDSVQSRLEAEGAEVAGLHYTGGTSVMDVHGYRAAEQWAAENGSTVHFSYLDSGTLRLNIDDGGSLPVGLAVEFSLEELMALHGRTASCGMKPFLHKSADALAQAHQHRGVAKKWSDWCYHELVKKHRDRRDWKPEEKLRQATLSLPKDHRLEPFYEQLARDLPGAFDAASRTLDLEDVTRDMLQGAPLGKLLGWLGGIWLEVATHQAMQRCAESHRLGDRRMGVEVEGPQGVDKFELDVLAVRGYQVFLISCSTTSKKSLLKKKLFEAWARARQIGGTEAPVAVVSCSEDPGWVENEFLRQIASERRGHVRVFGRQHVPNLKEELDAWIEERKGD